jgi:uncharacterized membrane protein HdeD (DUF308 family)
LQPIVRIRETTMPPEEPVAGPPPEGLEPEISPEEGRHLFVLGVIAIGLGIAAIWLPGRTEVSTAVILGLLFMAIGVADSIHAFLLERAVFVLSWIAACLFFFAGALLALSEAVGTLSRGSVGMTSLPFAMAIVFWVGGGLRMSKGFYLRPFRNWTWVMASGLLGVVFGVAIFLQWRTITLEGVSSLAGISMIVDGASRIMLSRAITPPGQGS